MSELENDFVTDEENDFVTDEDLRAVIAMRLAMGPVTDEELGECGRLISEMKLDGVLAGLVLCRSLMIKVRDGKLVYQVNEAALPELGMHLRRLANSISAAAAG